MNLIFIMVDSLRQDHVGAYHKGKPAFAGIPACRTPNLDAFAQESVIFENAYPEALPTIPVRTQFFTGQRTLHNRPWQPLAKEDVSIAEILRSEGYTCGLITDCYHFRAPGMNFHRGFNTYEWVRGQEFDAWKSNPPQRDVERYFNKNYDASWRRGIGTYLANTDDFHREEDWFAYQVVDKSIDWLKKNRGKEKVFAWIDSFDPHEPWDPPARFDVYGKPGYRGKRLIMPMGGLASKWASPEEIDAIRALYAGEAAFVDDQLGRLFVALKDMGYYEDSVIVVSADHGHPLADHGKFLKGADRMYNELLKVPFLVRLPGGASARHTQAIVQFHDVLPTLLDMMGYENQTSAIAGRSFLPVIKGDTEEHRKVIITGYHEAVDRCIRDHEWTYIQRPEKEPDELYQLKQDPSEQNNLIDEYPEEAQRLARSYGSLFRGKGLTQSHVKGIQGKYELGSSGLY